MMNRLLLPVQIKIKKSHTNCTYKIVLTLIRERKTSAESNFKICSIHIWNQLDRNIIILSISTFWELCPIIFGIMDLFTIQGVEKSDGESERKLSFERNVKRKLFDNWKEATRGN